MRKLKKLKRQIKRILNADYITRTKYLRYYENLKINDKEIFLDSQHGNNLNGSIFYILEELIKNPKYKEYKIYINVAKKDKKKFEYLLNVKGFTNYEFVITKSKKYYQVLSTCKYIISDTSLFAFYIKKEGQVYLNVWHGTPLKCLGKGDNTNFYSLGNVQKNFLVSDYLLYPNKFMMEHMIEDYMLENICNAKVIMGGYPRNKSFFDLDRQKEIRKELNLENKNVFVYMPTWRGTEDEVEVMENYLKEIDSKLKENQILYVNLHPFIGDSIDYKEFKHITKFPKEYETYEFLSIADTLITDYSSVFFDYACTRRNVVLFTYDEAEYLENRGCYMSMDDLPFKRCSDVDTLIELINGENEIDYDPFIKKFCTYDGIDAASKICAKVILGEDVMEELPIPKNGKKNVLIYSGSLAKNGITTALSNLLNNIDTTKYNYYVSYNQGFAQVRINKQVIRDFKEGINYIATTKGINGTMLDKVRIIMFLLGKKLPKKTMDRVNKLFDYEIKRNYANIKFDTVIEYPGYDARQIFLFTRFDAKKLIYAHSDMTIELTTRFKRLLPVCKYSYPLYDNIVAVSDSLVEPMSKFVDKDKIKVANNIIDYQKIIENGKKDIVLDETTECSIDEENLIKLLNDKSKTKFINVGRYSHEKGHERLIKAFNRIWKDNKDAYLVIIGGHGDLYEDTLKLISSLPCKDNIVTIKSLSNPFPVVKKCDCFILSSFYEGFGLCLVEADILGLATIAVDIEGPKKFIEYSKGCIVEENEDGIYDGMKRYLNGEIKKMDADYKAYNEDALQDFYNLLK